MKMYRQSRQAALIYANSEEELHKQKRDRKLFIILCITAFFLACLGAILLLGSFELFDSKGNKLEPSRSLALMSSKGTPESNTLGVELAKKLLRMHVIANSDSSEDQSIKLLVRNAVVTWISENMDEALSKEEAMDFLNAHLYEITLCANKVLSDGGFNYHAKAEITMSHFPGKIYGDFYLPAGDYDALKITLGEGKGKNWWCIAFPALCLYGNADYEDESGKRDAYPLFEFVLDEDEYEEIQVETVKIEFKCKWIERLWPF